MSSHEVLLEDPNARPVDEQLPPLEAPDVDQTPATEASVADFAEAPIVEEPVRKGNLIARAKALSAAAQMAPANAMAAVAERAQRGRERRTTEQNRRRSQRIATVAVSFIGVYAASRVLGVGETMAHAATVHESVTSGAGTGGLSHHIAVHAPSEILNGNGKVIDPESGHVVGPNIHKIGVDDKGQLTGVNGNDWTDMHKHGVTAAMGKPTPAHEAVSTSGASKDHVTRTWHTKYEQNLDIETDKKGNVEVTFTGGKHSPKNLDLAVSGKNGHTLIDLDHKGNTYHQTFAANTDTAKLLHGHERWAEVVSSKAAHGKTPEQWSVYATETGDGSGKVTKAAEQVRAATEQKPTLNLYRVHQHEIMSAQGTTNFDLPKGTHLEVAQDGAKPKGNIKFAAGNVLIMDKKGNVLAAVDQNKLGALGQDGKLPASLVKDINSQLSVKGVELKGHTANGTTTYALQETHPEKAHGLTHRPEDNKTMDRSATPPNDPRSANNAEHKTPTPTSKPAKSPTTTSGATPSASASASATSTAHAHTTSTHTPGNARIAEHEQELKDAKHTPRVSAGAADAEHTQSPTPAPTKTTPEANPLTDNKVGHKTPTPTPSESGAAGAVGSGAKSGVTATPETTPSTTPSHTVSTSPRHTVSSSATPSETSTTIAAGQSDSSKHNPYWHTSEMVGGALLNGVATTGGYSGARAVGGETSFRRSRVGLVAAGAAGLVLGGISGGLDHPFMPLPVDVPLSVAAGLTQNVLQNRGLRRAIPQNEARVAATPESAQHLLQQIKGLSVKDGRAQYLSMDPSDAQTRSFLRDLRETNSESVRTALEQIDNEKAMAVRLLLDGTDRNDRAYDHVRRVVDADVERRVNAASQGEQAGGSAPQPAPAPAPAPATPTPAEGNNGATGTFNFGPSPAAPQPVSVEDGTPTVPRVWPRPGESVPPVTPGTPGAGAPATPIVQGPQERSIISQGTREEMADWAERMHASYGPSPNDPDKLADIVQTVLNDQLAGVLERNGTDDLNQELLRLGIPETAAYVYVGEQGPYIHVYDAAAVIKALDRNY